MAEINIKITVDENSAPNVQVVQDPPVAPAAPAPPKPWTFFGIPIDGMKIKKYILDRLQERNTWVGMVGSLSALGVIITPEQTQYIISAGMFIAGSILAGTKG